MNQKAISRVAALSIGFALTMAGSASAEVVWKADFETNDISQFNLGPNQHWTADFSLKKWHQMVMHIHWSPDPEVGRIKLWYDGKVVVDIKAVTKSDKNPMFFQPGIHRADRSEAVDTIYLDNFIEADALADVMPVKATKRR